MKRTVALTAAVLRGRPLPDPTAGNDKNSKGRVLAVAGSASVPGAALLAGTASLRAGAGKVQLAVPRSIAITLGASFPESGIVALDETAEGDPLPAPSAAFSRAVQNADAVLVGPGLMDIKAATALTAQALDARPDGLFLLDALALRDVQANTDAIQRHSGEVILTPHHGEMAAILGVEEAAVARQPLKFALKVAAELRCIVVLKSSTTYIVSSSGEAWQHDGGCIGLATAGSGDVLAGIISGLGARGADPVTAAMWGVFVHGKAGHTLTGRWGSVGFLAREILELVPLLCNAPEQPCKT
jgi:ADP-dependent NAD(P)H-hydrate dehydratase